MAFRRRGFRGRRRSFKSRRRFSSARRGPPRIGYRM